MSSDPPFDPPPAGCGHKDVTECTAECDELNRKFDEWVLRQMLPPVKEDLQ